MNANEENENKKLHLLISNEPGNLAPSSQHGCQEIKDIYDSIYGNVQSKLEFYENKRGSKSGSISSTPTRTISLDYTAEIENNIQKNSDLASSTSSISKNSLEEEIVNFKIPTPNSKQEEPPQLQTPLIPAVRKISETTPTLDLLKDCSVKCLKCEKSEFIKDRSEVLTEINANLKIEIDNVKQDLKKEIENNNELNFEIANIENALELYYKEAKFQKTTMSSIYSSLKNYSKQEEGERYTYKRIKAIADYIETLKVKLQHQDRIIRDKFVENPYTTDMMMKYDAIIQQLDKLSTENQGLKNEIKKRAEEEVEIIKELNRQKFKVEEKCREVENLYKKELSSKDGLISDMETKHKQEIAELNLVVEQKIEEMSKLKKMYEARLSNFKDELAIVYRKWRNDISEKTVIEK